MNSKRLLSLGLGTVLAAGGCAAAGSSEESAAERLANQARAIAVLSAENQGLREQVRELSRENRRLRSEIKKENSGSSSGGAESR